MVQALHFEFASLPYAFVKQVIEFFFFFFVIQVLLLACAITICKAITCVFSGLLPDAARYILANLVS